jgi:hypothetical protein
MDATITTPVLFEVLDYDNLANKLNHITDSEKASRINISPAIDINKVPVLAVNFELPDKPLEIDYSLNREQVIYLKNYFDSWLKNNPAKKGK